jgi:hypothetical protein
MYQVVSSLLLIRFLITGIGLILVVVMVVVLW